MKVSIDKEDYNIPGITLSFPKKVGVGILAEVICNTKALNNMEIKFTITMKLYNANLTEMSIIY